MSCCTEDIFVVALLLIMVVIKVQDFYHIAVKNEPALSENMTGAKTHPKMLIHRKVQV